MSLSPDLAQQLDAAATPSRQEIEKAVDVVLRRVGTEKTATRELQAAVVEELGGSDILAAGQRHGRNELHVEGPDSFDRDTPIVAYHRLWYAGLLAVERLRRTGLITPVENSNPGWYTSISIRRGGHGFGHRPPHPSPSHSQGSYVATRALPGEEIDPGLERFLAGVDELGLNDRGVRCLREAIDAHARGLHLASCNLLGAVVESAWFEVGEAHPAPNDKLRNALKNDRTALVIDLVAAWLRESASDGEKSRVDEVVAFAGFMRTLRNYGIHPRPDVDDGLEPHFFDSPNAVLVMQAFHHVRALHALRDARLARVSDG